MAGYRRNMPQFTLEFEPLQPAARICLNDYVTDNNNRDYLSCRHLTWTEFEYHINSKIKELQHIKKQAKPLFNKHYRGQPRP